MISAAILPSPLGVASSLPVMVLEDGFLVDVVRTTARVLAALVLASTIGVPLGLLLGYKKNLYLFLEGPLHALRSVPATALFPLLLIVLGVGEASVVAMAAYPSLLIILVNSATGCALANKNRIYLARLLNLGHIRMIKDILFYEALPNVLDGLRTAVSYSLALVVAVEMFVGVDEIGLGRKIYNYQSTYRIPETYASIVVAGAIGIVLNLALTVIQNRLLAWLPYEDSEKE